MGYGEPKSYRADSKLNNPLFPALRSSPTAVKEPPTKSKFLAIIRSNRALTYMNIDFSESAAQCEAVK
jgi:hypothetical protein